MIAHKNKNKFVTTIKTNIMHDILFYEPLRSSFSCIANDILLDECAITNSNAEILSTSRVIGKFNYANFFSIHSDPF